MPVVLRDTDWPIWLDPRSPDHGLLQAMLSPHDDIDLRIYPVSQLVNNVRNDGPELVAPLGA
jgi:putative SOS response-associated peptidase YedK